MRLTQGVRNRSVGWSGPQRREAFDTDLGSYESISVALTTRPKLVSGNDTEAQSLLIGDTKRIIEAPNILVLPHGEHRRNHRLTSEGEASYPPSVNRCGFYPAPSETNNEGFSRLFPQAFWGVTWTGGRAVSALRGSIQPDRSQPQSAGRVRSPVGRNTSTGAHQWFRWYNAL